MILLAAGSHRLLMLLKQDRDFTSAILTLPTAMYSSECPLFPQIWVDDWIMFANSRDALQILIRRTAALLRKYGMAIKPEKVQWIANDQVTEVHLQYEGETIMRKSDIMYIWA